MNIRTLNNLKIAMQIILNDNKKIFKFKYKFEKMFIQYSASGRSVSKFKF